MNDEMRLRKGICSLCVYKYLRANPIPFNNHSITINNVADVGTGGRVIWPLSLKPEGLESLQAIKSEAT